MSGDYGSLVWVNDRDGREFVCVLDNNRDNVSDLDALSDSERRTCSNVNDFIGTDRW